METILKNIGKDSGFGDNNNSWYIEENNNLTIIDAGFTVFNEIKHRFDLSTFNNINIVITHLHTDHSGSLPQIVIYAYYIHKK
jgi:metal-dependent hydrolases of the metallobeta-lactamase superfamily